MKTLSMWIVLFILTWLLGAGIGQAGEIDDLVRQVNEPVRFKDHVPDFRVEETQIRVDTHLRKENGLEMSRTWIVMDGDRCVAFYPEVFRRIELLTPDPAQAQRKIVWPTRYHWATIMMAATTVDYWYLKTNTVQTVARSGGGPSVAFKVVTRPVKDSKEQCTFTVTIRFDAVLGYCADMDCELALEKGPGEYREIINVLPSRGCDPWPGRWRWDWTLYTPAAGDRYAGRPFAGWANNWYAIDRSDSPRLKIRDGGFVAFADERTETAVALTRSSAADLVNWTCPVWMDQHCTLRSPDRPNEDGLYVLRERCRMVFLPPRVLRHVRENLAVNDFGDAKAVMLRLGAIEDFEDQPRPLTTTEKRIRGDGLGLTSVRAHSGRQSAVMDGRNNANTRGVLSLAPQIMLDEESVYRLEAWVYVEGDGTEASITADLYRANVHWPDRLQRLETRRASSGPDWQKIELDIDTAPTGLDPFVDLRFRVVGPGKAFFDDLHFRKIAPGEARHESALVETAASPARFLKTGGGR